MKAGASELFLDGKVMLCAGDCLKVMRAMNGRSVDAIITDAPYHLASVVKRFGKRGSKAAVKGKDGAFNRVSRKFVGKKWDDGEIAFEEDTWREMWRVMKPGAHLVAFAHAKNYHRMATAIEDAGFEIRDMLGWLHSNGLPKTHPVKASPGWGTATAPAIEPMVLARRPLEGTVAANMEAWNVGAINTGACQVGERFATNILAADDLTGLERFMLLPKAQEDDRLGSKHATIKPVMLMRWLCRLVTPKGGLILDPFAGTGTTAEAAYYEGFRCTMIEKDETHRRDIAVRMAAVLCGLDERKRLAKRRDQKKPDALPLFKAAE